MEVAMTEQGTLKELNVKPGDVVEWLDLEKDNIFTVISASVITEGLYQGEVRARLEGYGGGIFDKEQFRIISRAAQATPDLTAIKTRNILAKQIIGKVEVMNNGKVWMQHTESAAEMRAAAETLNRMADMLEPR